VCPRVVAWGLGLVVLTAACGGSESNFDPGGASGAGGTAGSAGATAGGSAGAGATGGAGTGGAAGSMSTGGGAGSAGAGASGGSAGTSAAGSAGAGTAGTAGTGSGACTITVNDEISSAIATVGIVRFSTDAAAVSSARIEFGLDTSYGMTAPVDLAEPEYRTLLLGMKQNREYHYRVVVNEGADECASADRTIMTGALPNILPELDVVNFDREALAGGFVMTGQYQAMGGETSPAYILDADGEFVWALPVGNYVTGVRMSYDGKHMWINGTNNTTNGRALIYRVTMDGLEVEDLSEQFGFQDHQITVLPDETVVFYGHEQECPDIKLRRPDGSIETVINARDAHGAEGPCHVNHIEYSPDDETLIFSDDNHDNYTKVTMNGEVVWVLGGTTSHFTGDGAQWSREHGLDVLAVDRVLYFNNGEMTGGVSSRAIELQLDLTAMTATRTWIYTPMPSISNAVLGDVQRMENGNTVIAFSAQGVIHEVDAEGNLLQEINWPIGGAFGYISKRPTLYGPSPR
jgi:hypothetical protein